MKPSVHPSNKRARNKALREAKQARAKQRVDALAENIRLREENASLRVQVSSLIAHIEEVCGSLDGLP